jgi:glycosyltransferase involved in cell wall biosynthesis
MLEFPDNWKKHKAVLSHDWLTGMRGGERVLEILCRGFPDASILTLIHKRDAVSDVINTHPVIASWLQRLPGIHKNYRRMLPFFPSAVRSLAVPEGDLMISTSHCVAKAVRPRTGMRHLCYCFTPMRYALLFYEEYFGKNPIKALAVKPLLAWLRRWDRRRSRDVHRFVAISRHVANRIRRFYGRESDVVYPPVDTDRWTPGPGGHDKFDLVVSALVPYKRVDLAIRTYTRLGSFLEWQTDDQILELYRRCRLLVFPGEEDFGIVPLEAQACGKPVVAFGRGGALETVIPGKTGIFFDEQTNDSLAQAVDQCASTQWEPDEIRAHAELFATQRFVDGLAQSINACLAG